jgi:hypothetical protein
MDYNVKTKEETIEEWARVRINPMFTVDNALYVLDNDAHMVYSKSKRYIRVYRLLERMVKNGKLMVHGTKNGGNIYLLRERIK